MSVKITKQLLNKELVVIGSDDYGNMKIAGVFKDNGNWKAIYDSKIHSNFSLMTHAINFVEDLIRKDFEIEWNGHIIVRSVLRLINRDNRFKVNKLGTEYTNCCIEATGDGEYNIINIEDDLPIEVINTDDMVELMFTSKLKKKNTLTWATVLTIEVLN